MTHYADPRINAALGIEGSAEIEDTLAAIAQLRASVAGTLRDELFTTMAETLQRIAGQRPPFATVGHTAPEVYNICDKAEERLANLFANMRDVEQRHRAELKAATEERDEARNANARIDHNYRLLQHHVSSLEAKQEQAEDVRATAYAVIHHLTARFAP